MKFSVFQLSRKGGRDRNEDRMGYCYTRGAGFFVLADGMGGHPEGEVAAQIALQTVSAMFQRHARPELPDVRGFLSEALLGAHQQLLNYASFKNMTDTPRTTLVAAVVQDGRVTWAHCGDSRLYLVRGSELIIRTRDHSYAEHPTAGTGSSRAEPFNRNVLFTCLGSPTRPLFDITGPMTLRGGDRILLCSDGLWSVLGENEILTVVSAGAVSATVPELVERALRSAGTGSDNVTALAMQWDAADTEEARGISTDTIGEEVFASTIQHGVPDAAADEAAVADLDDEAIERSIAEINEAIRRSAQRKA